MFLILIAVALFAALSYAVTSSTRSGGGDASDETNLVNTASITQYPTGVRTALIRMQVSRGVLPKDMEFNAPSEFTSCSSSGSNCVFHPSGGNATYTLAPPDVMADGQQGEWTFNGDFEIELVGNTSDTGILGNEIIAFLPGVTQGVCDRINTELGINTIPVLASTRAGARNATPGYLRIMDNALVAAGNAGSNTFGGFANTTANITLGTNGDDATGGELDGQAFGCFRDGASGDYVYYHVIYES